jgi:hypothetical protein
MFDLLVAKCVFFITFYVKAIFLGDRDYAGLLSEIWLGSHRYFGGLTLEHFGYTFKFEDLQLIYITQETANTLYQLMQQLESMLRCQIAIVSVGLLFYYFLFSSQKQK